MSGGTLIALAADEVIMSDHAVLGPLDPQIGQYPAPALMNLKRIKSYNEIEDDTLIKADMAAKATEQIEHSIEGLLQRHQDAATAQRTANMLTDGRWTHDYPITPDIAEQVLQLPVSREMPKQVLELMSLYRSAHQNQGVEYLPFRRGKETDASTNATIRWQ
jgi:ClpP class serine protease